MPYLRQLVRCPACRRLGPAGAERCARCGSALGRRRWRGLLLVALVVVFVGLVLTAGAWVLRMAQSLARGGVDADTPRIASPATPAAVPMPPECIDPSEARPSATAPAGEGAAENPYVELWRLPLDRPEDVVLEPSGPELPRVRAGRFGGEPGLYLRGPGTALLARLPAGALPERPGTVVFTASVAASARGGRPGLQLDFSDDAERPIGPIGSPPLDEYSQRYEVALPLESVGERDRLGVLTLSLLLPAESSLWIGGGKLLFGPLPRSFADWDADRDARATAQPPTAETAAALVGDDHEARRRAYVRLRDSPARTVPPELARCLLALDRVSPAPSPVPPDLVARLAAELEE